MSCSFAKFLEWKGIIPQYKAGAFDAFKIYKVEVEKQKKNTINIVSLDKDREYYGRWVCVCVKRRNAKSICKVPWRRGHYCTIYNA